MKLLLPTVSIAPCNRQSDGQIGRESERERERGGVMDDGVVLDATVTPRKDQKPRGIRRWLQQSYQPPAELSSHSLVGRANMADSGAQAP